ncbi:MAG: L-seryl-tRNA(Sec) selenium transferase [Actinobacteria bacterium]|nr:L-seryl-tRNA(Sec) selenium transferase [Actinomycetota bacterium]
MVHPPSVDTLARSRTDTGLPHPLLVDAARAAIAAGRHHEYDEYVERAKRRLLVPVINATGVLLHTNMGRAPLSMQRNSGYSNLELNLDDGRRGSRQARVASLIARASGAEAAVVVNNCAAAVMLGLAAIAKGGAVPVSRGELVEIGGGFRVPDVLKQSGSRLVEVGTTNRTRIADYEAAITENDDISIVLKVHPSNYRIEGFQEETSVKELATLGLPVIVDLGSGLLDDSCPWLSNGRPAWLGDEPAVRQTLGQGADLVMFSGDKLLGGPQAGIIAGRADLVEQCSRHPLMRALRPGDLILEALQTVALAYLNRDGDAIDFWRTATAPIGPLRDRAEAIVSAAGPNAFGPRVIDTEAAPGGGSLPTTTIASVGVSIVGDVTASLRAADTPIIARVNDGSTIIDLRAVDPADDHAIISALGALGGS